MNPNIPAAAVLAHAYLFAFDCQGEENQLWCNSDLLYEAPSLDNRLKHFLAYLAELYHLSDDKSHALSMPRSGTLHLTIRAVAQLLAYSPTNNTPAEIADILVTSMIADYDAVSQHIGRHPFRLAAYTHYVLAESALDANASTDEITLTARNYVRSEIRGIVGAFHLAAQLEGPPCEVINREELISRRKRIAFVI